MAARGEATENGYAERLIRTIKEEEVHLSEYRDYLDALTRIGRFLDDVYMRKRIHSALGYLTPAEYEARWYAHQNSTQVFSKKRQFRVQFLGSSTFRLRCR